MRIAVCTISGRPDDRAVWSGTPSHFVDGLRDIHDDVVLIGPLLPGLLRMLTVLSRQTRKVGRKVNWEAEPIALRLFTLALDRRIAATKPDVVILMGWYALGSRSAVPLLFWGDATVGQRIDKAPHWQRLSNRTRKAAPRVEARALRGLAATMWSSRWAQDDAQSRYGLSGTHAAPFAANLIDPRCAAKDHRDGDDLTLLAVGVQWHRKGMDTAVETARDLSERGMSVHLHIVGVLPPDDSWKRPYVTYHGFLSKGVEANTRLLDQLYRDADIFLLPTRLEPFGIVFQEAAAYALPAVTARVGGVPEIVEHDVTGITLVPEAAPSEYADAIAGLTGDRARYTAMSAAARERFTSAFTWTGVAARVVRIAEDVAARRI